MTSSADAAARNDVGVLHGGVVTALRNVPCYPALLPELADGGNAVTHDLVVGTSSRVPQRAPTLQSPEAP